MDRSEFLKVNQEAWNKVAPQFFGGTALPEYGPLALTEDDLHLIDDLEGGAALELRFGSGHSLAFLYKNRSARELWGIDLSHEQLRLATGFLTAESIQARLLLGSMDENPGIPTNHFDLLICIYGLGWSPNLEGTLRLAASYLKPGGVFVFSWEHPAYHCLEYEKDSGKYVFAQPYVGDKIEDDPSWKGVRVIIPHPTLSDFVNATVCSGLHIEKIIESPLNLETAKERQLAPDRWYTVPRARLMPTTLIVRARKPGGAVSGWWPLDRE